MADESGCPYYGRTDGVFVTSKTQQSNFEKFFRSDFSLYECPGCALLYCARMTPDALCGLDEYYAARDAGFASYEPCRARLLLSCS